AWVGGAEERESECLHHRKSAVDPLSCAVAAGHVCKKSRGHSGERDPEVRLGPDLLHVGRRPSRFTGEYVELHEKHGLAYVAKARVDEASFVRTGTKAFDERLEAFEILVSTGQCARLAPCAWRIRVVALVHPRSFLCRKRI